ncbi:VTT domain-containing protein [Saprospiraceae bacterium]|nr:VTT domain-containing protein [Saprospiraceae bacterium]
MEESLLTSCGLVATFLGTLLEGEISMITSVVGAMMGYYNIWLALLFGFAGAWVADWFKFIVGRTQGQKLLKKKPKLEAKFNKASGWFDKHPYLILLFYKLMFGMTTVILVMAGVKGISYVRFAILSGISIIIWVGILSLVGTYCAEPVIHRIKMLSDHKLEVLGVLSVVAFLYWFFVKRPHRKECLVVK